MQKFAERKPAKKIEEELAIIRMVPRKTNAPKAEKPPKEAVKAVEFEGSKLIFEGKTTENRIVEIGYWDEKTGDFSFQIKFSGQREDFSQDPQKLLDMLTDYVNSDEGVRNCRRLFFSGANYLYKKLGAEGAYELPEGMYGEIEDRLKSVELESDRGMKNAAGLSYGAQNDWGSKNIIYGIIGALAGAILGFATQIKNEPATRNGISIVGGLSGFATGMGITSNRKTRKLEIKQLDAAPHEITHAISNNRRIRIQSREHLEAKFEEGMTSLLVGDWAYEDYRKSITEFVKSLPKKDRKPALDVLMKGYLNVELTGEEGKQYLDMLDKIFNSPMPFGKKKEHKN